MRLRLLLIIFSIASITARSGYSQTPHLQWARCYGGGIINGHGGDELAHSMVATADGGFLILGNTNSYNNGDVHNLIVNPNASYFSDNCWLLKINSIGEIEWEKCLTVGVGNSIIHTFDGGYAIAVEQGGIGAGWKEFGQGMYDGVVIKLSSTGEVEWQKAYGGSKQDGFKQIIQLHDSSYAVLGYTGSIDRDLPGIHNAQDSGIGVWLVKLDTSGEIISQKIYSPLINVGCSITEIPYQGIVIAGSKSTGQRNSIYLPDSSKDAIIVRTDSMGDIIWSKIFTGIGMDEIQSVISTSDGNLVFTGFTNSADSDFIGNNALPSYLRHSQWVGKLTQDGVVLWQHYYPLSSSISGFGCISIIQTREGGYAFTSGNVWSYEGFYGHGNSDLWIAKLDSMGKMQWQIPYGGSLQDFGDAVLQTADGFIMAGYTTSKYNDGDVSEFHGGSDLWVVKIGTSNSVEWSGKLNYHQRVFPNPATTILNIASIEEPTPYKIVDILGRTVMQGMVLDRATLSLDISSLPGGVYFVFVDDLRDHHPVSVGKVMIVGK